MEVSVNHFNINSIQNQDIIDWIEKNKPDSETSKIVAKAFNDRANIFGNLEFRLKVRKIIYKTSQLATGITILKRILSTDAEINIIEREKNCFVPCETHLTDNLGNSYVLKEVLYFSFVKHRTYDICKNKNNENELLKQSKVSSLIHECLHKWHYNLDSDKFSERHNTSNKEFHTLEEKKTISGKAIDEEFDFCNENTANIEIGRSCRIGHGGVSVLKTCTPTLIVMLETAAFGSIKKALLDSPGSLDKNQKFETGPFLLDAIVGSFGNKSCSEYKTELAEIVSLLMINGFATECPILQKVQDLQRIYDIKFDVIGEDKNLKFNFNVSAIDDKLIKRIIGNDDFWALDFFTKNGTKKFGNILQLASDSGTHYLEKYINHNISNEAISAIEAIIENNLKSPEEIMQIASAGRLMNVMKFLNQKYLMQHEHLLDKLEAIE